MLPNGIREKKIHAFNGLSTISMLKYLVAAGLMLSACGANGDTRGEGVPGEEDDFEIVVRDPSARPDPTPAARSETTQTEYFLRDDAPGEYVVKKGDTLWDISRIFLETPWAWPELWYFNPQIENPHLIFPGERLVLVYVDGRPRLMSEGDSTGSTKAAPRGTIRLSPRVRRAPSESAITTLDYSHLEPFLNSSYVLTQDQIEAMPSIVGSLDDHLISGINNTVYAKGRFDVRERQYEILRLGRQFKSLETGEVLGIEGIEVGSARLKALDYDDTLGTLAITDSVREVLNGDLITPLRQSESLYNALPRAPDVEIAAKIIALHDALANVANTQIVIIDAGAQDGLQPGHVVVIDQRGAVIRQRSKTGRDIDSIQLPNIRAGLGLVFRVFDRICYVLITDATRAIHIGDDIRNPDPVRDRL